MSYWNLNIAYLYSRKYYLEKMVELRPQLFSLFYLIFYVFLALIDVKWKPNRKIVAYLFSWNNSSSRTKLFEYDLVV